MKKNIDRTRDSGFLGNAVIIYSSDMICALLGFVSLILIARTLGPAGYGVFTISIVIMGIAYQLSDFGLSPSTVKFASPLVSEDDTRYRRVILASLRLRLLVSTAVLVLGALLSWVIADFLTDDGQGSIAVLLAFAGGFATSLFAHTRLVLQCEKRFGTLAMVRIGTTGGTTTILIALIVIGSLAAPIAVAAYAAMPLAVFAIFLLVRRDQMEDMTALHEERRTLIKFSKWMFAISILSAVFLKLDVIFLGAYWTELEVGVYSVALTLIFPVTQFANSVATVLMPDISSIKVKANLHLQLKKSLKVTIPIAAVLLAFAVTSLPAELIPLIFGAEFSGSVEPFKVLCITASSMLIAAPIYLAAYPIGRPKVLFHGDSIKFLLHIGAYAALVPSLGIMGAAWGSAVAMGVGSTISIALVLVAVKKAHEDLTGTA